ncbi:hypothetical protein LRY65_02930 [Candidatus Woesebacteria bacterium]|nr:hypothetical protein [Candidatus Woesebacteria bacterium]MCD8507722.1 hypothetical protein [Candidatus Woesebacteria bacterium]MCD8527145.1 hypothetical protein [Candidatus Woesebacteria bacterium]MCD8546819.1 hypothetical protein [Candidatus Woesebacteria bacterium]
MAEIYRTTNFILESHERPEVDRNDGGHIKISPIEDVSDRTQLSPALAIELMRFTMVAGLAFTTAMAQQGITLGRINYQENGNWKPHLHIHLYGRAINAQYQKFGDPIKPGHREEYQPLTIEDCQLIATELEKLFGEEKFSDQQWGL